MLIQKGSIPAPAGPSRSFHLLASALRPLHCFSSERDLSGEAQISIAPNILSISSSIKQLAVLSGYLTPALAAGGAEWRGLTSCLPGWLQAEGAGVGGGRRAAKDEGERERTPAHTPNRRGTNLLLSSHPPPSNMSRPSAFVHK